MPYCPFANIWLPDTEGETLEGEVIEVAEGQYGIYASIKNVEDGRAMQTPAHKVLQSRVELVSSGDFVKIIYWGKSRTQTGREVNSYRLLKKKDGDK